MTDEPVERGASEDESAAPMTETEAQASRRPPSAGDSPPEDRPTGEDRGDQRPEEDEVG